jgi:hypothetical protein
MMPRLNRPPCRLSSVHKPVFCSISLALWRVHQHIRAWFRVKSLWRQCLNFAVSCDMWQVRCGHDVTPQGGQEGGEPCSGQGIA